MTYLPYDAFVRNTSKSPSAGLDRVKGNTGRPRMGKLKSTSRPPPAAAPMLFQTTTKTATATTSSTSLWICRRTPETNTSLKFFVMRLSLLCRIQSSCVYTVRRYFRDSSPYGTFPLFCRIDLIDSSDCCCCGTVFVVVVGVVVAFVVVVRVDDSAAAVKLGTHPDPTLLLSCIS